MVKSQVLSSERKTERVREDASGDREDGKDDDDMPCVIGESEGDWLKPSENTYLGHNDKDYHCSKHREVRTYFLTVMHTHLSSHINK